MDSATKKKNLWKRVGAALGVGAANGLALGAAYSYAQPSYGSRIADAIAQQDSAAEAHYQTQLQAYENARLGAEVLPTWAKNVNVPFLSSATGYDEGFW